MISLGSCLDDESKPRRDAFSRERERDEKKERRRPAQAGSDALRRLWSRGEKKREGVSGTRVAVGKRKGFVCVCLFA